MIRLTVPSIGEEDLAAVRHVLESGYLVQGKNVAAFEEKVAQNIGVPEAIAVANCTASLHLALLALNVGPGDIVLVTAYSWIATANVIEVCGARPEFVDITSDTFNMDSAKLEQALVRLMGNPATARWLPTPDEARQAAESERVQAEAERVRAEAERQRVAAHAEQLQQELDALRRQLGR